MIVITEVADDAIFSNLSKGLNEKRMSDYYGILFMSSMEKGRPVCTV